MIDKELSNPFFKRFVTLRATYPILGNDKHFVNVMENYSIFISVFFGIALLCAVKVFPPSSLVVAFLYFMLIFGGVFSITVIGEIALDRYKRIAWGQLASKLSDDDRRWAAKTLRDYHLRAECTAYRVMPEFQRLLVDEPADAAVNLMTQDIDLCVNSLQYVLTKGWGSFQVALSDMDVYMANFEKQQADNKKRELGAAVVNSL